MFPIPHSFGMLINIDWFHIPYCGSAIHCAASIDADAYQQQRSSECDLRLLTRGVASGFMLFSPGQSQFSLGFHLHQLSR